MKFPMTKNWLVIRRTNDGRYKAKDFFAAKSYYVPRSVAMLARKLDGKTDPYCAGCGFSHAETDRLLQAMDKNSMLRYSKTLLREKPILIRSIIFPRLSLPLCTAAFIYNFIVRYLWLPLIIYALIRFGFRFSMFQNGSALLGYILGMYALGAPLHELAHAAACIRCRGRVFEMGIMFIGILPAAYCMNEMSAVKSTAARVHTLLAGVEANMLLAGLTLLLAFHWHSIDRTLLFMSIANIVGAITNFIPISTLMTDGYKAMSELERPGCFSTVSDISILMDYISSKRSYNFDPLYRDI